LVCYFDTKPWLPVCDNLRDKDMKFETVDWNLDKKDLENGITCIIY
jgi:hypothetical protein